MNKLKHYLPNYVLSILLVFSIVGVSLMSMISSLLSPSFFVTSIDKHNIYQRVSNYTEDYFAKNSSVSSIPAEIYMNGFDEKIVKQAVDGKINNFFDYVNRKTDKVEDTKIDFSQLEKNINDFFNEFAEENNVEINDSFTTQLNKTIEAAEKDIDSFTNVYMLDYMEKSGIHQKLRTLSPFVPYALYGLCGISVILFVILILINKKDIKSALYWLATSGLCASIIMLIPCLIIKSSDYFSRLVMRTDYIYYAITGLLNDIVNSFMKLQLIILGISIIIMILYMLCSKVLVKKNID